jgi:ascorbate-specific PTS system EIIC-type component UlaA
MIPIPDFLTFLANNTIIALLALVAWIFVVAAVVWLGEKAVEKFRQRLSWTPARAESLDPENGLASDEVVAVTCYLGAVAACGRSIAYF